MIPIRENEIVIRENMSYLTISLIYYTICLLISDIMHDHSILVGLTLRAKPRMATLHPGLQARILFLSIEAGTDLMDVGEVAVAEDAGIGVGLLQATEQAQQGAFLAGCAGVGGIAMLVEAPFVADNERVLVVAYGVGAHQLFMARLVGPAVAGDVVVVARESEPFRVTADEGCHGKVLARARGRTVDDNQINVPHDCTKNELIMAVNTVMMNWMMFFQRFMSLNNFIILQSLNGEY